MIMLICLKLLIVFLKIFPPFVSELSSYLFAINCERKKEKNERCLKCFYDVEVDLEFKVFPSSPPPYFIPIDIFFK